MERIVLDNSYRLVLEHGSEPHAIFLGKILQTDQPTDGQDGSQGGFTLQKEWHPSEKSRANETLTDTKIQMLRNTYFLNHMAHFVFFTKIQLNTETDTLIQIKRGKNDER